MQSLGIIGDVHARYGRLERVLGMLATRAPDLLLFVGDIGLDPPRSEPRRTLERAAHDASVREVIARGMARLGCPAVFVPGNHDLPKPTGDAGAPNADGRVVEVAGLRIAGFGGAGPARFGFPYEWSEVEAEARLARGFGALESPPDIFLCHTPPAQSSLDRTASGEHVGSTAVARWIERLRPRLFACGHIHESFGLEQRAGVPCLNAGALGEPFGREIAWWVAWDDGPQRIESLLAEGAAAETTRVWLER